MIIALALTSTLVAGAPEPMLAAAATDARAERPTDAGVPAALVDALTARATERGVAAKDALGPVKAAAKAGVPARPVAEKILEGLAKGVPPARVLAVARGLADRLVQARDLLDGAHAAGLAAPTSREVAIADLASALGEGVPPDAVRALVSAARGGRSDAVVAAALTLGDLAHRGVPVDQALPLAQAEAVRPPVVTEDIASLYDEYRREGGDDLAAFLAEAARRIAEGIPLDGMIDRFDGSGMVRHDARDGSAREVVPNGRGNQPGDVPGLEDGSKARAQKPRKGK